MIEGLNVFKMFSRNRNEIPDYGMFSDAGNEAVNDIVLKAMSRPGNNPELEIRMAEKMLAKLRLRFGEAQDTAVIDNVRKAILSRTLRKAFAQIPSNFNRKRKISGIAKDILNEMGYKAIREAVNPRGYNILSDYYNAPSNSYVSKDGRFEYSSPTGSNAFATDTRGKGFDSTEYYSAGGSAYKYGDRLDGYKGGYSGYERKMSTGNFGRGGSTVDIAGSGRSRESGGRYNYGKK